MRRREQNLRRRHRTVSVTEPRRRVLAPGIARHISRSVHANDTPIGDMDIQALAAPTTRPAAMDGAFRDAVPEPGPEGGWLVSRNCPLGGGGPRINLVLLHPSVGVALVDFAPKDTDAVGRFRSALDGRRFSAVFGGYPPTVRAILPTDRLSDLGRILAEEFKKQPPLSLACGDAWIRSARAAIEAEAPVRAPEPLRSRRLRAFPWRTAALAVTAGGLVGAFVALLAPPGRGPENPAGPAGAVPTAAAPDTGTDALAGAEPGNGGLTASDVRAALASADPAIGAGAEVAPKPQEAGNAAPPPPPASEGRPDAPPEAVRAAALLPPDPQPASNVEPTPDGPVAAAEPPPRLPTAAPPPEPERPPAAVAAAGGASPEPPPPAPVGGRAPRPSHPLSGKAHPDASGAAAAADPRPAPKRPAVPAEAPSRPATQAVATTGRRTALPATPAEPGGGGRCGAILARAMVGGTLSDDDREYLRRGCDRRG